MILEPSRIDLYSKSIGKEIQEEDLENNTLKYIIMKDLLKLAKSNNFEEYEKPQQIKLILEPLDEKYLMTPTLKLKRHVATEYFRF